MTREETIKILAILKAAYPNSYKNMTKEEASGTVTVWAMQFATIPAEVVMVAVNKLISTSPFPPAICEVKERIRSLYWEAWEVLKMNETCKTLTAEQEALYRQIFEAAEGFRNNPNTEPSLTELIQGTKHQPWLGSPSYNQNKQIN